MQAPLFWYGDRARPGWRSRALAPLAALYATGTARRLKRPAGHTAKCPVICIGNINAGGTGKTPATMAIVQRFQDWGITPHVVSRGYGGSLTGPVQVDPLTHRANETGDEPLLLAAFCPTWVAKDRAQGVRAAEQAGAQVILLDDGFQSPAVAQDLALIVVDAAKGFGNGRVMPAGPLREPVQVGMARGDLVLSVGAPPAQRAFGAQWHNQISLPHLKGALQPLRMGMDFNGLRVLAFAGIGHPEKFFTTVKSLGAEIVKSQALDDHQPLTDALMKRLELEAAALGAQLVTTEKDAVRLPADFRRKVLTVPVRLEVEDWTAFDTAAAKLGLKPS